jgi:hypothetical protein
MEPSKQRNAIAGEPALYGVIEGDGGQPRPLWKLRLSDVPDKPWRDVFNAAAATDRAASGYAADLRGDTVRFEATRGAIQSRLDHIEAWIERANDALN